jgi:Holliday junction resolvasome RuvABC endonuclease subunit
MSIDASSKATGVAIFNENKLVHYECIYATEVNAFDRINKMTKRIEELYTEWKVNSVAMEDVIPEDVRHNQQVFKVLHYLQASVVLMLHKYKQSVTFYVSSEWRKKCGIRTGRGITREMVKQSDINFVKDKFNITVNDDIADAIGIGYAHLHPTAPTSATSAVKKSAF